MVSSAWLLSQYRHPRESGTGVQAFTGATLIDGDGARFDNAVLVIRDGRVTPADQHPVAIPKEARQIPLAGKFVIRD